MAVVGAGLSAGISERLRLSLGVRDYATNLALGELRETDVSGLQHNLLLTAGLRLEIGGRRGRTQAETPLPRPAATPDLDPQAIAT